MPVSDLSIPDAVIELTTYGLPASVVKGTILGGTSVRQEGAVKLFSDPFTIAGEGNEWIARVTLDLAQVAIVSPTLRDVVTALKSFKQGARGGF